MKLCQGSRFPRMALVNVTALLLAGQLVCPGLQSPRMTTAA